MSAGVHLIEPFGRGALGELRTEDYGERVLMLRPELLGGETRVLGHFRAPDRRAHLREQPIVSRRDDEMLKVPACARNASRRIRVPIRETG